MSGLNVGNYNSANGYSHRKDDFTTNVTKLTIWNVKDKVLRDVRRSAHNIKLKTSFNEAMELTFTVLRGDFTFIPWNGDQVQFAWDDKMMFTGWIFKRELNQDSEWQITAYGNSRYLKGTGTYVWPATSSSDRFDRILSDLGVPHSRLDRNSYKVKAEISDGTTFFDMINQAAEESRIHTGKRYIVMDDPNGKVLHVSIDRLATNKLIGDKANVSSWKFNASIEDTRNIIQVVHEDSKTKRREVRIARDNRLVNEWGPLIHTETVSGDVNTAQLQAKANDLLKEKRQEKKEFSLTVLGDTSIRAGSSLYIAMWDVGGVGVRVNQRVLVTSATQNFDNPWTMDLEVIAI